MKEENIQTKSGESVRKIVLTGVFVFAVAAIVSSVNTAEQEVALYPVEVVSQSANVGSVFEKNTNKEQGEFFEVRSMENFENLSVGSIDPVVFSVEYMLSQKGFLVSQPDERFTQDTLEALKNFQSQNGLIVDGKITIETLENLFVQ